MIQDAIKFAQAEMTLSGREDVVVTNVVPTDHPLACEIHFVDGKKIEVSGLVAVCLLNELRRND